MRYYNFFLFVLDLVVFEHSILEARKPLIQIRRGNMKKIALSIILSFLITTALIPQCYTYAIDTEPSILTTTENVEGDRAAGLIVDCALSCSGGSKTVYINAEVYGSDIMGKIGFKNIKVQRSTNQSTWTTEKTVSDKISEDAAYKILSNYAVSVDGGYYYRIVLDNYAKEKTWWFPETQTFTTTSNSVWIS